MPANHVERIHGIVLFDADTSASGTERKEILANNHVVTTGGCNHSYNIAMSTMIDNAQDISALASHKERLSNLSEPNKADIVEATLDVLRTKPID